MYFNDKYIFHIFQSLNIFLFVDCVDYYWLLLVTQMNHVILSGWKWGNVLQSLRVPINGYQSKFLQGMPITLNVPSATFYAAICKMIINTCFALVCFKKISLLNSIYGVPYNTSTLQDKIFAVLKKGLIKGFYWQSKFPV